MEYLYISSLLLLLGTYSCYLGSAKAKATINVPTTILLGQPTSGSCVASGKMYSWVPPNSFIGIKLADNKNEGKCIIKPIGNIQKIRHAHYRQDFNITCDNGNKSVGIKCFTHVNADMTQTNVQVIKPKITTKPCNKTAEVGQSVTLTCDVEGDPDHYWVGWMSRNTIINAGDEHSISTSPNFRSLNGTKHYLTIHSIKVSDKYECKLYTIQGDVQDQVTHHVIVDEESHKESRISTSSSSSSSSLFNILKTFFF